MKGKVGNIYLTTSSIHYIYCYMPLDIWQSTTQIIHIFCICHRMSVLRNSTRVERTRTVAVCCTPWRTCCRVSSSPPSRSWRTGGASSTTRTTPSSGADFLNSLDSFVSVLVGESDCGTVCAMVTISGVKHCCREFCSLENIF